ncbi:methyltransferase [uncultured Shimia sp.]|uniref:class I SAM-dependent methyltransferase n=1 Tax=uncultured Shimia sp. TaxID=573152 RepID=UPI002623D766|nr:methyltransferase [uncultured Shimia sp.]
MSVSRLTLAVQEHGLELPDEGRFAVFAPRIGYDLSALPKDRCDVVQPLFPDHTAFARSGFKCVVEEEGDYSAAIVCLPRAKAQARDLIARAVACADLVIVDGQKTEGAESLIKDCRKKADLSGTVSKAHGKLFWFRGGDFADWQAPDVTKIEDGLVTRAGVFSADGIDPASRALVNALPENLGRNVSDLGAGWGYLSVDILKRPTVETLYLIEADHTALDCAKQNVTDERARFFWADVTTWEPRARMDTVVMNPPFHTGRTADPSLGAAFITAASRMLAPTGQLWMVANRHLPYETTLSAQFAKVEEVAGDNRFKILHATRPARARR